MHGSATLQGTLSSALAPITISRGKFDMIIDWHTDVNCEVQFRYDGNPIEFYADGLEDYKRDLALEPPSTWSDRTPGIGEGLYACLGVPGSCSYTDVGNYLRDVDGPAKVWHRETLEADWVCILDLDHATVQSRRANGNLTKHVKTFNHYAEQEKQS